MTISDAAQKFDFNSWFGGASLPQESADVYLRGDLVARMNYLGRRVEEAQRIAAAAPEEESLGEDNGIEALVEEYAELLETFAASRVTIYLRALEKPERVALRKAHDAALVAGQEGDEGFVIRTVAQSIVGLQAPGQTERTDVRMQVGQVKELYSKIGEAQLALLFQAQQQATNAVPTVSADFLLTSSGPAAGPES